MSSRRRVIDRQRRPKRKTVWLRWICNPLMLKVLINLSRAFYEIVRFFLRQ